MQKNREIFFVFLTVFIFSGCGGGLSALVPTSSLSGASPKATPTPTSTPAASTYGGVVTASSPLAYWPLNEGTGASSAIDQSGNGYDVNYSNQTFVTGPMVSTISGDVAAHFVANGSPGGINPPKRMPQAFANIAVEAWINAPFRAGNASILNRDMWDDSTGFGLEINSSGYAMFGHSVGSGNLAVGTTNIEDSAWHYVVGTMQTDAQNSSKCIYQIYVDGVMQGSSGSISTCITDATSDGNGAGTLKMANWDFYTGAISRLAVYGQTFTADLVNTHFVAGGGTPTVQNVTIGSGNSSITVQLQDGSGTCTLVGVTAVGGVAFPYVADRVQFMYMNQGYSDSSAGGPWTVPVSCATWIDWVNTGSPSGNYQPSCGFYDFGIQGGYIPLLWESTMLNDLCG